MDSTDFKILTALRRDADRSRKLIARDVGLSEPSLSKKVALLKDDGILRRFTIDIDYDRIGYGTHAITLIKLRSDHKNSVTALASELASHSEAVEVSTLFGNWDIFVKWLCRNPAQINAILKAVWANPHVAETETLTLAERYRDEHGPDLAAGGPA